MHDFLHWYLAPWSRIGRAGFNAVWVVASIPSLLAMLFGIGEVAGGGMQPLMDVLGLRDGFMGGDPVVVQAALLNLHQQVATPAEVAKGVDWMWWLDSACWVALLPLVMMRLRDMGVKNGTTLWVWVGVFYAPTVMQWIQAALMIEVGMLFNVVLGVAGFGVMAWLCVAPSAARTVTAPVPSGRVERHERDGDIWR